MESTTVTPDDFLKRFLKPPKGKAPAQIREKILHWLDVANNPEAFGSADAAARRKSARQNVCRLVKQYPEIAAEIVATVKPEEVLP